MNIRKLMTIGLMAAGFAAMANAQSYYGGGYEERRDIGRDLRVREDLSRRIEADRRAVEHERWELRNSPRFAAGHEYRELRAAEDRLARDSWQFRTLNGDLSRDINRERFHDRY